MRQWMMVLLLVGCMPKPASTEDTDPKEPEPQVNEGRTLQPDATRAQICADDCLLLTRFDVHTLKHRFKDLCCGADGTPDDPRCETNVWPFPPDQSCKGWERLEMCVYAKYGYVFKEDSEWKAVFEAEPWYRQDGTFTASQMSIMTKRNTLTLRQLAKEGVDCTP